MPAVCETRRSLHRVAYFDDNKDASLMIAVMTS